MVEEVRSVGALVESILQEYITGSIGSAATINNGLRKQTMVFAAVEILLLIVASVAAQRNRKRLMNQLLNPIENVENFTAQVAGGDLSAPRLPKAEMTELVPLTESINSMADRLESLFGQIKREQDNLRKAELRTLQAQINPHFLYNTLDAIVWQAEEGRNDEVIRTTRALSDFFRISLSSGDDWIPVSQ
ncbi:MAG: histidine kinase [Clostridia bacterium]|nr:histidine kinase [Clostridia bacterium]